MSAFGRLGRSLGRAAGGVTHRMQAALGLVLTFVGLIMLREIGDILSGARPVTGTSPAVAIGLLAVGALVAIGFGVRFIFRGF